MSLQDSKRGLPLMGASVAKKTCSRPCSCFQLAIWWAAPSREGISSKNKRSNLAKGQILGDTYPSSDLRTPPLPNSASLYPPYNKLFSFSFTHLVWQSCSLVSSCGQPGKHRHQLSVSAAHSLTWGHSSARNAWTCCQLFSSGWRRPC